jgi:hypothetical protein
VTLLLALACTAPRSPAGADDSVASDEEDGIENLTFDVADGPGTVATVRWTTPVPGDARVDFGEDQAYSATLQGWTSDDGLEHAVLLAGLAAGTDWHWRAASQTDGGLLASEDAVFSTPDAPDVFSSFSAETHEPSAASGEFVLTSVPQGQSGAVILDAKGRAVWWTMTGSTSEFVAQARMSADNRSVLVLLASPGHASDNARLLRVPLDGSDTTETLLKDGHHDFVELEDGGFAYLAMDVREAEGFNVAGDALMQIEEGGAGGARKLWSVWDDRVPTNFDAMPPMDDELDWSHLNGIAVEPDGDFLVSSHNFNALFSVARTGGLRWQLGGDLSDFALSSGAGFDCQHGPTLVPGGFLVFVNHCPDTGTDVPPSEVVEYTYDESTKSYAEAWRASDPVDRSILFMGSATRLGNGNTLVSWGSDPHITEVEPDGTVAWEANGPMGSAVGFTHPVATLGGVP